MPRSRVRLAVVVVLAGSIFAAVGLFGRSGVVGLAEVVLIGVVFAVAYLAVISRRAATERRSAAAGEVPPGFVSDHPVSVLPPLGTSRTKGSFLEVDRTSIRFHHDGRTEVIQRKVVGLVSLHVEVGVCGISIHSVDRKRLIASWKTDWGWSPNPFAAQRELVAHGYSTALQCLRWSDRLLFHRPGCAVGSESGITGSSGVKGITVDDFERYLPEERKGIYRIFPADWIVISGEAAIDAANLGLQMNGRLHRDPALRAHKKQLVGNVEGLAELWRSAGLWGAVLIDPPEVPTQAIVQAQVSEYTRNPNAVVAKEFGQVSDLLRLASPEAAFRFSHQEIAGLPAMQVEGLWPQTADGVMKATTEYRILMPGTARAIKIFFLMDNQSWFHICGHSELPRIVLEVTRWAFPGAEHHSHNLSA